MHVSPAETGLRVARDRAVNAEPNLTPSCRLNIVHPRGLSWFWLCGCGVWWWWLPGAVGSGSVGVAV